ncbi:MAG: hypothetical protein ACTS5G_00455, partial [Burkholderiales bacterium]
DQTTASEAPILIEPPDAAIRVFDGLPVRMVDPPGRLVFALDGDERLLSVGFGMDPKAYLEGESDGASFFVDLQSPGGGPQHLFQRNLNPRDEQADRGLQLAEIPLPPSIPPGSTLILRTGPGPHGDFGWDWVYYTRIWLRSGDYLPAQFPGFNTVPVEADVPMGGRMYYEDRDVFMMNAPGSLTFALSANSQQLRFSGGYLDGAWQQGQPDGADFVIEYLNPDDRVVEIWRRTINPLAVESDRGTQEFSIPLPQAPAGTRLRLRTTPGEHGNNAWDWTYVSDLTIE